MDEVCCTKDRIYLRVKNKDGRNWFKCNNCGTDAPFPLTFKGVPTSTELIESHYIEYPVFKSQTTTYS